jgi:hypothetical protein
LRFAATIDLLRRFAAVRSGVQSTKAAGSSAKDMVPPLFFFFYT